MKQFKKEYVVKEWELYIAFILIASLGIAMGYLSRGYFR